MREARRSSRRDGRSPAAGARHSWFQGRARRGRRAVRPGERGGPGQPALAIAGFKDERGGGGAAEADDDDSIGLAAQREDTPVGLEEGERAAGLGGIGTVT